MNLLFLTPQLPYPPHQGTAIRNWGIIQHLADKHHLTLLTFAPRSGELPSSPLQQVCRRLVAVPAPVRAPWRRLFDLLSGSTDLAGRLRSGVFERALTEVVSEARPDIVQIEGLEMAPYLPAIRAAAPYVRIVYDAHNAEHVMQRRALAIDLRRPSRWPAAVYSALQIPRLARFEARTGRAADAITCVSPEDAAALRRLDPGLAPVVVPNGINLSEYAGLVWPPTADGTEAIVFTGKMDYRPNVDAALWFAEEILPRVRAERPKAEFHIVGQQPVPQLVRRHGQGGVIVTGAVPDTRPYIAGAAVYVAALRMGGGTRFKLLEAFALGLPTVATQMGAEGFGVESGRELLLAENAPGFATAVLRLLADPVQGARLGQAALAFVRANYDWSVIIPRLTAVYAGLTVPGPTAPGR